MKKALIKTFGCQMNEQDSRQMRSLLAGAGYTNAADEYDADLVLINTCAVRDKAVQKAYSELGRLRPLKEDKPGLVVALSGCVAEQERRNLQSRFPFLDLVFGPDHIRRLPEMIAEIERSRENGEDGRILRAGFNLRRDFRFLNVLPDADETPAKAFVTIQKGCDNVCSFCIVPFVRGREVSRPHGEILSELGELSARGVKDVTLLGQNVNSYGLKTPGAPSFARLLALIAEAATLKRLRFTTSHPKDVGSDLIGEFRDNPILMPYFHLPVQSGSDRVLNRMRRQYTRGQYLTIVEKLKAAAPKVRFATDVIVGFPGESDDDFRQTLSLVEEVGFDQIFSFVYSPRPRTKAVNLPDLVSPAEKSARLKELQNLTRRLSLAAFESEIGQSREVLVESRDETAEYPCMGRTPENRIVHFRQTSCRAGDIVHVEIVRANAFCVFGAGPEPAESPSSPVGTGATSGEGLN